ncbi:MAG TPA: hypothetical protein VF057_10365 [Thermoanaerobaculia bacterium]
MKGAASLGLLLIAALAAWHFAWVPHRCNVEKRRLVVNSVAAAGAQNADEAAIAARRNAAMATKLLEECGEDVDLLMLQGANLRGVGDLEAASGAYLRAIAFEPRPELYFELGSTQMDLGRRGAAVEAFTLAVRFYPSMIASVTDREIRAAVERRVFQQQ